MHGAIFVKADKCLYLSASLCFHVVLQWVAWECNNNKFAAYEYPMAIAKLFFFRSLSTGITYPLNSLAMPCGIDVRDHVTITRVIILLKFITSACSILSFGASAANKYKVIVDGRDPMLFETSQVCALTLHLQLILSIT